MPYNGSGTFTLTYTWATEAGSPPIAISKLDTQELDLASGLSNAICRDGQSTISANIPFNDKRITGLGAATARTDAARASQVQDGSYRLIGSVAGTNTITGSLTPAITAYAAGQMFVFEPANNNTGATTINLNSVGAVTVAKWDGDALASGDLVANVPAVIVYDGSQFILLNPQGNAIGVTAANILSLLLTVDGSGSGLDADLLDGLSSAAFATASHTHNNSDLTADINSQTGSFSVASSMDGDIVVCDSGSTITVTVGSNALGGAGKSAYFVRRGAGAVTFSASGVTINSPGGALSINQQHGGAALMQITSTVFELKGNV